jgi:Spy/CpxP family protein refolding chaperone
MESNRTWLAAGIAAAALLAGAAGTSMAAGQATQPSAAPLDAPNAGPGGPHGWHRHHGGMAHLLAQLNLTAQQQASIKTILAGAAPQMKTIHEEMRANSLKLQQTQPTDPNYANVVAQVTQANGSLHSQMITQREAVRAQVFKVLTPAQQSQLATLQAQKQAQREARMQGRGAAQ